MIDTAYIGLHSNPQNRRAAGFTVKDDDSPLRKSSGAQTPSGNRTVPHAQKKSPFGFC
jgi:hypothetical protein